MNYKIYKKHNDIKYMKFAIEQSKLSFCKKKKLELLLLIIIK